MFANAVSLAACRANLSEVMTEPAYSGAKDLAARLAKGLQTAIEDTGLPWSVIRLGTRAWCCYRAQMPRNAIDVRDGDFPALRHLQRVYLANRGVWDFGWWAGPVVGLPATPGDIDAYVVAWSSLGSGLIG
jgi:glutamate-1-semialdehyde 2,1-aminomutase